jgi:hypothetical protein
MLNVECSSLVRFIDMSMFGTPICQRINMCISFCLLFSLFIETIICTAVLVLVSYKSGSSSYSVHRQFIPRISRVQIRVDHLRNVCDYRDSMLTNITEAQVSLSLSLSLSLSFSLFLCKRSAHMENAPRYLPLSFNRVMRFCLCIVNDRTCQTNSPTKVNVRYCVDVSMTRIR